MAKKRDKRKKEKVADHISKLKPKIVALLDNKPGKAYSLKQIVKRLGYHNRQINREIPLAINILMKEDKVKELPNGSYASSHQAEVHNGIVDHVSSRFAYILMDEGEDVFVRSGDLKHAMDRDRVSVMVFKQRHGQKREGKVTEILERAHSDIVGRIAITQRYAFVTPDNKKIHEDVFIRPDNLNKATNNDKVVVHLTEWPARGRKPEGRVMRVLGQAGENDAEIHSIMAEYGLPFEFPEHVMAAAATISDNIKQEVKKRRDFRTVTTFTIDPEDAKDFDDALSFRLLDNGNYEIGVH
ncbi:MAG: RNB domain-containing ribonuclease, partial [Cyclobacteriaceae bacterium]|nr:RNB domain-containing ribonuclease [Cyclobacteriaceae bacterium]